MPKEKTKIEQNFTIKNSRVYLPDGSELVGSGAIPKAEMPKKRKKPTIATTEPEYYPFQEAA